MVEQAQTRTGQWSRSRRGLHQHLEQRPQSLPNGASPLAVRRVTGPRPPLVFVFSGLGAEWRGAGRQLLAQEPIFCAALEQCDALFQSHTGWSLLAALRADKALARMHESEVAHATNFALQVALAALWRHWGIEPDVIVGHSAGEPAAAYVAGVLSLEDAVRVVYHQSRLLQRITGQGKMAAIGLPVQEVEPLLAKYAGLLSLAAINSPASVTVGGDADALAILMRTLEQRSVYCRLLRVEVPYHSPTIEPLREELIRSLQGLNVGRPLGAAATPIYSSVTGQCCGLMDFGADYWWRNIRQPVYFAAAMQRIIQDGNRLFLELSPQPALAQLILQCLHAQQQAGEVLASLGHQQDEAAHMRQSLARLFIRGFSVAWSNAQPDQGSFGAGYVEADQCSSRDEQISLQVGGPEVCREAGSPPPHSPTEERLSALWASVLGVERVSRQDNFFDLGGHSLCATQLIHRVQETFAVTLSVRSLYEAPTIAAMAQKIDHRRAAAPAETALPAQRARPLSRCLIPLQTEGTQPPFFCVHPVAGAVFPYHDLAVALGDDQPVYGLQAVGLSAGEHPFTDIEAMAKHYVSAMRLLQPNGPYLVGGWSFGAHVAYEMAQQLHQVGERVALLALIDTAPATVLGLKDLLHYLLTTALPAIWPYVFDYLGLFAREKAGHHAAHPSFIGRWTGSAHGREAVQALWRHLPAALRIVRVMRSNTQAQFSYTPQPYPGHIALFRTDHAYGAGGKSADLGWQALAQGGVEIYRGPGHHLSLLRKPNVEVLARQLRHCLLAAAKAMRGARDEPSEPRDP
jgi:thioesterase domain-containing protein/malonyl CoA-acyl carrier protein transacylase